MMEIVELKNVLRKDSLIHYINEYHADLVFRLNGNTDQRRITVVIERNAFGGAEIRTVFDSDEAQTFAEYLENINSFLLSLYKDGYFPK